MNQPHKTNLQSVLNRVTMRQLFQHEWQIKQQQYAQWLYPLLLFVLIMVLFPLSLGQDKQLLAKTGVAAVWIAAILSALLDISNLFKPSLDNGYLAQLIVAQVPLQLWVLIRVFIHWLFSFAVISILSLLVVPFFGVSWDTASTLLLTVLLASPTLVMFLALSHSLSMNTKQSAMLLPLLAIPLQMPILIFATGAVELQKIGLDYLPVLALLSAGSILSVMILPWVIVHILKMAWLSE